MSKIEIKKIGINSNDYQLALEVRKSVFVVEQGVPEDLEISDEKEGHYFIGLINDVVVATARYRVLDKSIKVERVATLPEYRGRGMAKKLMEAIQEDIDNNFKFSVYLNAQETAVSFYLKLGWIIDGDEFEEAGIKHFKMVLP